MLLTDFAYFYIGLSVVDCEVSLYLYSSSCKYMQYMWQWCNEYKEVLWKLFLKSKFWIGILNESWPPLAAADIVAGVIEQCTID